MSFSFELKMPEINKHITRLQGITGKANLYRVADLMAYQVAREKMEKLQRATPVRSGITKNSWKVKATDNGFAVINDHPEGRGAGNAEGLIFGQTLKSGYDILPHGPYPLRFTGGGTRIARAWAVRRPSKDDPDGTIGNKPDQKLSKAYYQATRNLSDELGVEEMRAFIRANMGDL